MNKGTFARCGRVLASLLTIAIASCGQGHTSMPGIPAVAPAEPDIQAAACTGKACSPIKHIVIIIQENRSFENLFAGYPGADAPMTGTNSIGKQVALHPISMLDSRDVSHIYATGFRDVDGGKMDGFNLNPTSNLVLVSTNPFTIKNEAAGKAGDYSYAFVGRAEARPYWAMARRYTLSDRMFPTNLSASWTAHIAFVTSNLRLSPGLGLRDFPIVPGRGFSSGAPWNCDASPQTKTATVEYLSAVKYRKGPPGPPPCFSPSQYTSMADTLDKAKVSWRYYAPEIGTTGVGPTGGLWSAFGSIKRVRYGPDWKNVINPPGQIIKDVRAGTLAQVTWVVPDWYDSDHAGYPTLLKLAGAKVSMGPAWVASIVNTIGMSRFWKDTAIIVTWDEWGGFYDNVSPPRTGPAGQGVRVPAIAISPYARPGFVSHTTYEFGSVLKFVEQTFNVPPLGPASAGYTDSNTNSIVDSFDFKQKPLAFKRIPAPYPASCFYVSVPTCLPGIADIKVPPDDDSDGE